MMAISIEMWPAERHAELTAPLRTAFGLPFDPERAGRMQRMPELAQRIAALDDGRLVGSAGGFHFTMTTPGGSATVAGLTMVGVLPTHRRRGILTSMMRRHFEQSRASGLSISALWASEGMIYGRFGYGVASLCGAITLPRDRSAFSSPVPREGTFRLVEEEEALAAMPAVYDRVRAVTPGMMSRSHLWWPYRRVGDFEKGAAPLQRVVLELDGRPEGYALYRMTDKVFGGAVIESSIHVTEAVATSPRATALLWRYLCDIDIVKNVESSILPVTHPLLHLVAEIRRLKLVVSDALWVRLIDVEAALGRRAWSAPHTLSFALEDPFCPWNEGTYVIDGAAGRAAKTSDRPELRLGVAALGSLYLGGVTPRELADAGLIEELSDGAVDRAAALFRSSRAPWCAEIF